MPFLKTEVTIDKQRVMECLQGTGNGKVPGRLGAELDAALIEALNLLQPRAYFRIIDADAAAVCQIQRHIGGSVEQVAVAAFTIGDGLSQAAGTCFQQGQYLKGMLFDVIGNVAMEELSFILWRHIVAEAAATGMQVSGRQCPGDGEQPLMEQALILKALPEVGSDIRLTGSLMLAPVKSATMVYGLGHNVVAAGFEHNCRTCSRSGCCYRRQAPIMIDVQVKQGINMICLQAGQGEKLQDVLIRYGLMPDAPCGGRQTCGKCLVKIIAGSPSPAADLAEVERLGPLPLRDGWRLACALRIFEPMTIELPAAGKQAQILSDSLPDEPPSKERPSAMRQGLGLAVDIGTTTVVAELLELSSGRRLGSVAALNPQRSYGADVISRIEFTMRNPEGLSILHSAIIKEINRLIETLCAEKRVFPQDIRALAIVGNTTMLHVFANVSCVGIGRAPFTPVFTDDQQWQARQLGIAVHPEALVKTLPCAAAFVGADIVADIMACGMFADGKPTLLLDIGTNGEMALSFQGNLACCATAAGPAFEGAGISCGTVAIAGAIHKVDLLRTPLFSTIGDQPAIGICGSGLIDGVAELLRFNLMTPAGRLKKAGELTGAARKWKDWLAGYADHPAFQLDEDGKIRITQRDIRQLQLAKGAIWAGARTLCEQKGVPLDKIERVYIAGGFGNYLNIDNAIAIRLLPSEFAGKILAIGNGALAGARRALLNVGGMEEARALARRLEYIELSGSLQFSKEFVRGMGFGYLRD